MVIGFTSYHDGIRVNIETDFGLEQKFEEVFVKWLESILSKRDYVLKQTETHLRIPMRSAPKEVVHDLIQYVVDMIDRYLFLGKKWLSIGDMDAYVLSVRHIKSYDEIRVRLVVD